MADQYYWIGTTGPFKYDDAVPVNDTNLLFDGVAAPDARPIITTGQLNVGTAPSADGQILRFDDIGVLVSRMGFGVVAAKTIAGGAIALVAGERQIQLTGEGDAADSLTSITGAADGDEIVLRGKTAIGYIITVVDGGNLHLQMDFGIDSEYDTLHLMNIGSDEWVELSRSSNA